MAHLSQAGSVSVREIHQRVDMDELELTLKGRNMIAELAPIAQKYEQRVLAALVEHALCFRTALDTLLGEKEIK